MTFPPHLLEPRHVRACGSDWFDPDVARGCRPGSVQIPKIAFEKYTLPNGLDVILHEDHSTPIVGVNVWYHAGSKNERPGRTGFAHLFEHMMFQGSKHYDKNYFGPAAKGRRQAQRLDRPGPHQLLGTVPVELPGVGPVDGVGPHGLPPAGHDPGKARQPARRSEERTRQSYENRPYGLVTRRSWRPCTRPIIPIAGRPSAR